MPFTPIADAGIPFQFGSTGGASMIGSVISATNADNPTFDLTLTQHPGASFRVTFLNYLLSGVPSTVATFYTVDGGDSLETPNVGGLASFSPSPLVMESFIESGEAYLSFVGANAVGALQETFAALVEVWVDDGVEDEDAFARTRTAYVSGYQRTRVHVSDFFSYETGPLAVNLNGAMGKDRRIVNALWQTWNGSNVVMSDPKITTDGKSAFITAMAQIGGRAVIKASLTLDNGQILVQQFCVNVNWAPVYYPGNWVIGPQQVSVSVP